GAAEELLRRKAEHASYVATQMLFDPAPLLDWVAALRAAGIDLPVRPGVAAPASRTRLLRIGTRIGVGRSLRMLPAEASGAPGLVAPHVFTFNSLEETAAWWARRPQHP